ncbi:MAG: endonuclease/exonuclease/phosphatase family protein [Vulcanimicrobiota bacterium]
MKVRLFLLLLLFYRVAPAQQGRWRLCTWNLHNFFDSVDDPYGDQVPAPAQVEKKVADLSQALGMIGADVVAVQEVEKRSLLERLAQRAGYRYAILVPGNDEARGINIGLLSRLKVKGYASHRRDRLPYVEGAPLDTQFSRDCLEVHLRAPEPVILLVNHFKSKVGKGKSSDAKRRAQAMRVCEIVADLEKAYPGQGVAVLGDMNDSLESWPLEPLAHSGLLDPFVKLSPAARYTLKHRGQPAALDQILINRRLGRLWLADSSQVGHDRFYKRCSDHFPMWLDFSVGF